MGLNYPGKWKFEGVGFGMPAAAASEVYELLLKIAERDDEAIEAFKTYFGGQGPSSSYDWAVTDLWRLVQAETANAAGFVDSLWKSIEYADTRGLKVPSADYVNRLLNQHGVPLRVTPPDLTLVNGDASIVDSAHASGNDQNTVQRFIMGDEIGRGGYGVVYRATRHTAVGEFAYALKVLDPSPFVANYDKALRRFRREVDAIRRLQHRAIVPYFEAGLTPDNKPYVVMPLIAGEDLRTAARLVEFDDCLRMFIELLHGLHYAHSNDVLHRDLKPSNVLVRGSDRQPVILDFGSAYFLDQLDSETLTTEAVGTIGYIPSEVLADPTIRSPLHDIYACGVMLYEVLAGRRPDPSHYRPLRKIRAEYGQLDDVLQAAIAGVKDRTESAVALADHLTALL